MYSIKIFLQFNFLKRSLLRLVDELKNVNRKLGEEIDNLKNELFRLQQDLDKHSNKNLN